MPATMMHRLKRRSATETGRHGDQQHRQPPGRLPQGRQGDPPGLFRDDEERKRRQKLMAEANRAYAEEDRVTLQAILEEWEEGSATTPSAVPPN